jgi:hypothetical protein
MLNSRIVHLTFTSVFSVHTSALSVVTIMTFIERLSQDIAAAMRSKEATRLGALRMAKAAIMNREVEKGRPLEDTESLQVIASLIKQRRDSIEQFTKGGREDLAQKEAAEITTLETYLPPALDAAALERIVDDVITELGASGAKDLGKVMKGVMPKLAGQAVDGKLVNEIVRRKLG